MSRLLALQIRKLPVDSEWCWPQSCLFWWKPTAYMGVQYPSSKATAPQTRFLESSLRIVVGGIMISNDKATLAYPVLARMWAHILASDLFTELHM